ncbi:MAG TPA: DUF5698 domain-containing protein [Gemmataceae bacterium]|nr:DUF5698 domain-containing protein [Gemmataceae bacterium]
MTAWLSDLFATFSFLPILVFVAELSVVTISTLRIIFLSRGMKLLAPVLGFFEITIWLFAIGQVMNNLSSPGCFLGFAGGFTLGNYLGVLIEKRLALGTVIVHTVTHRDATKLVEGLRGADYGVTIIDAAGARGAVKVVLTVVKRRELETVLAIIRRFDPEAFYSVDEVRDARPNLVGERRQLRGLFPSFLQPSRRAA